MRPGKHHQVATAQPPGPLRRYKGAAVSLRRRCRGVAAVTGPDLGHQFATMETSDTMDKRLAEAMELLKGCKASVMEEHQKALPRLPIPTLEQSLSDFRRAVTPLLSSEGLAELTTASESFQKVCYLLQCVPAPDS
jgi:hypothetical protein